MLCRPLDVIVSECGHEVVAVVVVGLHAKLNALVVASFLGCLDKVLRKELALLVKVVTGTLTQLVIRIDTAAHDTHHIDKDLQRTLPLLDQL
jgi:hypothetical protein